MKAFRILDPEMLGEIRSLKMYWPNIKLLCHGFSETGMRAQAMEPRIGLSV
jgi:hypothetical protein